MSLLSAVRTSTGRRLGVGLGALSCAAALVAVPMGGATASPASASPPSGTFVPGSSQALTPSGSTTPSGTVVQRLTLPGGRTVTVTAAGVATETDAHGTVLTTRQVAPAVTTALGRSTALPDAVLRTLFQTPANAVRLTLRPGVRLTGAPLPSVGRSARRATTSDAGLTRALAAVKARSVTPVAADTRGGTVVVDTGSADPAQAAARLRTVSGVAGAQVDPDVSAQSIGGRPLPPLPPAQQKPGRQLVKSAAGALPSNFGISNSLSAWMNGNGVDALGAYSTLTGTYGQLPGTGEIITNVSVGDLTDQAMADNGDAYVQAVGPTTVTKNGQRYLDLPSMPLIPTYVAGADGTLDPTGTTEGVDPYDDEIMLDFGVMAPLPHNLQRSGALGTGYTDLLGIAPGASYRLVVPSEPTITQIATAMLSAARQQPRPNVITASLGEGTDTVGYPGRYLEDDPLLESVIATIVRQYGIVVSISANDGTRLYTPTPVNPDGGSTPTNVTRDPDATTDVADDALSTTPSEVLDSGAIAVGGTTLDDVLTQPGQPTGTEVRTGTFAATRVNGSTAYSSGFGTRIDLSAPGDGIAVFDHTAGGGPQAVTPQLGGGTSASAPMVAAAAAVVQQASRLVGKPLGPTQIRALLERTARPVTSPKQSDRTTTVGPQLDLSAAVQAVLAGHKQPKPGIARISLAHHIDLGNLEGSYSEDTDPQRLDLTGDVGDSGAPADRGSGEGLLGPVTFGVDTVGLTGPLSYELHVGNTVFRSTTPSIRISPSQLLTAAGDKVVSDADRYVNYRLVVLQNGKSVAHADSEVTVGPTDGTYTVTRAPVVPATAELGSTVTVSYDLTGVRETNNPQLVVSHVGAWTPTGGLFWPAYSVALTKQKGTLTVPASAFTGGGGLYGIGIAQHGSPQTPAYNVYGDMASILVSGPVSARPEAPLLRAAGQPSAGGASGHTAVVSRASTAWDLSYDVRSVPGAKKAIYEISAVGPTIFLALNTVTNAFGTQRDADGVVTPSTAFVTTGATHGTVHLDANSLPVDAAVYNVRVFAADAAGHPIGEASPTSGLEYDDGLPPASGQVASFDAVSGSDSLVSAVNATGGQTVFAFDPATGHYGDVLTQDTTAEAGYQVVGVDPGLHRAVLLHYDTATQTVKVETWSTTERTELGSTTVAVADARIWGGRVDPAHHRALLLERRASDNADLVVTVDLATGALSDPINADTGDTPAGSFYKLELAPGTGDALLFEVTAGSGCGLFTPFPIARVDVTTKTVEQHSGPSCLADAVPDAANSTLQTVTYRSFSANFAGNSVLGSGPLGDTIGTITQGGVVRGEPPALIAVDQVNDVVTMGFATPVSPLRVGTPFGYPIDSNATGQLAELDSTGKTTKLLTGMEFGTISRGLYDSVTERRVQFDPSTRTAWLYSPDGFQLQAVHY